MSVDDYVDPMRGVSAKFQRRLNVIASLESQTKAWERRLAQGASINSLLPTITSSGLRTPCVCKANRVNAVT